MKIYSGHDDDQISPDDSAAAAPLGDEPSLECILAAWNDATERLQRTHETLQAEVARLTDELEAKNRELARQARLADLGRMAAHVAHEVRNSLMPVTLYLSMLRRRLTDDAGSLDVLTKVEAGFTTLNATVNDLLSFTAHREPRWQTFIIRDLIDEISEAIAPQLEAQGIEASIDVPPYGTVTADRELLRRAVLNLALNAIDVMPRGGELVITSFDGPRGFELEVADSGPGLSQDQQPRLFDPFYTTKETGTGLGLAIVQRIAEAHGGEVNAMNCPDGGAAFTIVLPSQATELRKAA
ncbi:MAG: two-component sensor histidine kinase [Planctomycetaceae bacterium]|nr:two-component sensor histidine kinase [Planctomycetaceae bacterium]